LAGHAESARRAEGCQRPAWAMHGEVRYGCATIDGPGTAACEGLQDHLLLRRAVQRGINGPTAESARRAEGCQRPAWAVQGEARYGCATIDGLGTAACEGLQDYLLLRRATLKVVIECQVMVQLQLLVGRGRVLLSLKPSLQPLLRWGMPWHAEFAG